MSAARPSAWRGASGLVTVAVLGVGVLLAARHASSARARRTSLEPSMRPVVALLPGPDLVLAGGARHLRSLSQAEPGAAFADGPGAIDDDPAGGAIGPPREAWVEEARRGR